MRTYDRLVLQLVSAGRGGLQTGRLRPSAWAGGLAD